MNETVLTPAQVRAVQHLAAHARGEATSETPPVGTLEDVLRDVLETETQNRPEGYPSRYDQYDFHPLAGIDAETLHTVRRTLREIAEYGDVPEDMIDPIADSVVAVLRQRELLRHEANPEAVPYRR